MSFSFNEPTSTHPNPTEPEATQTDAAADPASPEVTADNPTDVQPVEKGAVSTDATQSTEQGTEGQPEEASDEPKPDDTETPPESQVGECYFGDQAVEIDIPQDVTDALKEHGLDAVVIANELYSKGGEFKLSAETKDKLDKIYGKFAVDSYLAGLKAQNEGLMHQLTRDAEAAEKADGERFDVVSKEVGGADGWANLERFALSTLSDEELTGFNEVMKSGNQYLQMYAVRELEAKRKSVQGDDKVMLVDATGAASGDNAGPMSAQEYITAISQLGKQFGNDHVGHAAAERALDARRVAGQKLGI